MNKCSVCGKKIPYNDYEAIDAEIQCSIDCAKKAYYESPSYCQDCNGELTYYEAFAGGTKCSFCKRADKFLGLE